MNEKQGAFPLERSLHLCLLVFPEYDLAGLGAFDNGQRLQIDTGCTEAVAAALKSLFHGAAYAYQLGAGSIDDVDAPSGEM